MPTFNVRKYVRNAIESVIWQTYPQWELIIVDDGSTDGTVQILEKYIGVDPRIKIVLAQHGGRGKARNKCIEIARGKYIAIFDADDISLPNRLEKQVRILEESPEIGVVSCSRVVAFNDDYTMFFESIFPITEEEIRKSFARKDMPIINASAMIRARLFKQYGVFQESLNRAQDYEFYRRIHRNTRFKIIDEPLTLYRVNGLTVTWKYFIENALYKHYADYVLDGGKMDFDLFCKTFPTKFYLNFIVPIKYVWYICKRKLLKFGVRLLDCETAQKYRVLLQKLDNHIGAVK